MDEYETYNAQLFFYRLGSDNWMITRTDIDLFIVFNNVNIDAVSAMVREENFFKYGLKFKKFYEINRVLDYFNIPKLDTLEQRIAYFKMIKHDNL